ncbi:MAG: hypothetical protein KIT83_16200 [Bryobacterales bacterium]|nr:hypothetical protein [Bryobacterales bacterium]
MKKSVLSHLLTLALVIGISVPMLAQTRSTRAFGTSGTQTNTINLGSTTVTLSGDFAGALSTLGVSAIAAAPGTLSAGTLRFPITTGAFDDETGRFEFMHSGALALIAGDTRVELLHFTIDGLGEAPVLTGLVAVNGSVVGRLPLFNLTPTPGTEPALSFFLSIPDVQVTLRKEAADALNSVFNIAAFVEGFPIGTASILANPSRNFGRGQ